MHFRFDYFTEVLKKPYFESTQTLADVFGVHRNTVSKAIQTLKSVGYIEVTTKKGGSNTYTKVTTWLNGSSPASSTNSKTYPVKAAPVQKKEIQPEKHWWEAPESEEDEDNIPF
jgi:DNA-binding transcriptional MocR family regulator